MAARKAQPPRHGQIKVSSWKIEHARKHLHQMTADASEVREYGGHSVGGQGSQGSFPLGGAAGADYSTTDTGNTGDADSGGPSGY
jgi:hypothetical protein